MRPSVLLQPLTVRTTHYPRLLEMASELLRPGGVSEGGKGANLTEILDSSYRWNQ